VNPAPLLALALSASLCVGALLSPSDPSAVTTAPVALSTTADAAASAPAAFDCSERDALRAAQAGSADLAELKAGFAMDDEDIGLVLGTIAVVVLIALLL
jgi:hypothetical protein